MEAHLQRVTPLLFLASTRCPPSATAGHNDPSSWHCLTGASRGWSRLPSNLRLPSEAYLETTLQVTNLLVLTSIMSYSSAPAQPIRVRSTCDVCLDAKVRCSRDRPACRRCLHHGRDCVYSNKRRLGRPRGTTSRSRAASQSNDSAGAYATLSIDDTAQSMSTTYTDSTFSAIPQGLSSDLMPQFTQQHTTFNAGANGDFSFFPMWETAFGSDQGTSDTSGQEFSTSTPVYTHFDHDQHQGFGNAYPGYHPTSLGIQTTSSALVTNASNAGPASHVESPLDSYQDAENTFSTMLLRPVYANLHNGQRVLMPVMSTGYPPSDNSTPTSNAHSSACCSCYNDILQRLSELKQNDARVSTSELDQIMRLEMDIRIQILAMVRCESCLFERPRALLLVGVVLESVLDLLECVCVTDTPMQGNECLVRPPLDMRTSSSSSNSSLVHQMAPSRPTFQHAGYGLCSDERAGILRQLVRTRLHEVLGLTRHLHEHVQSCRSWASSFTAADTTMAEISHRIRALMNRLEG